MASNMTAPAPAVADGFDVFGPSPLLCGVHRTLDFGFCGSRGRTRRDVEVNPAIRHDAVALCQ